MNLKTLSAAAALVGALAFAGAASAQSASVLVRPDGIFVRCDQCGTVQAIDHNVVQGRDHGTAGAILGAVAGGVLGNQVGRGKGRDLATIGGAVGGGVLGNRVGQGGGGESWTLRVKMGTGGYSNVTVRDASAIRVGDIVMVDANGNVTRVQ